MKLLVYGTLKKGYPAEDLMEGGSLLQQDVVLYGYKMYTNGSYPMCVPGKSTDKIVGEVWDMPEENIPRLDSYEGHPHLFSRTKLKNLPETFMYVYQDDLEENAWAEQIVSGFF